MSTKGPRCQRSGEAGLEKAPCKSPGQEENIRYREEGLRGSWARTQTENRDLSHMNTKILQMLGVSVLLLAGCTSTVHTIESRDGTTTLTDARGGKVLGTWELKQVTSADEKNRLRKEGWEYEGVVHNLSGPDTFLMKRRVRVLTPANGMAVRAAFHPMLISTFGTNTSSDGTWRIAVSETSLDLARLGGFGGAAPSPTSNWTSTISPGEWKARAGWFVFIESKSNVWAYDGGGRLVLNVETMNGNSNTGGAIYENGYPRAVPDEVLSRLPEPLTQPLQVPGSGASPDTSLRQ